jgi:hypothetical protein
VDTSDAADAVTEDARNKNPRDAPFLRPFSAHTRHRLEAAGITTLEKLRSKILRDILSVAGAGEGVMDEVVTILSKRCLLPLPKSLGELLLLLASSARAREALEQRSYLGAASNPRPLLLPLPLCLLLVRCLFGDGEASKARLVMLKPQGW